jgi:peptidoglycan hydrolase CwlO-like protein
MSNKSQKEIARLNWGKTKGYSKYAAVKDLTSKIKENQKEIKKWADFGEEDKSNIDRMKKELKKEKRKFVRRNREIRNQGRRL